MKGSFCIFFIFREEFLFMCLKRSKQLSIELSSGLLQPESYLKCSRSFHAWCDEDAERILSKTTSATAC
ncbi:unnamed protein product [Arabidopsis halleri]